jgi:hypothetical protein
MKADPINNVLYAGGVFTDADGIPVSGIAKWNGVSWSPIGMGILSGLSINSMVMKDGELIVGGTFTDISGTLANNIAKWDGSMWLPLGSGLSYTGATTVSTLCVYDNELYAGGTFTNSSVTTVNYIAKWDGSNWQPVGGGTDGKVLSLCVFDNKLYAGGTFTQAGGVPVSNIAVWDGTSWADVGGGVSYTGATTVSTMQVYDTTLYVGGTFDNAGGSPVMNIAKWDGTGWSDVGGGVQYTGATTVSTLAMTVFQNELVVGGVFDIAGSIASPYISKWDGSAWSPLGTGMNNSVTTLETLQDTLYAGGTFTIAGDVVSLFAAQWQPGNLSVSVIDLDSENDNAFVTLYPNPAEDHIRIAKAPGLDPQMKFDLVLTDLLGREILKVENVSEDVYLDRTEVPTGMYIYRIISKDLTMLQQGKISIK